MSLWILGLGLLLLMLGGLSVDLWRLMAERRELVAVADAAAAAAASGIDEEVWRSNGELLLDPVLALERADRVIVSQPVPVDRPGGWFQVDPTGRGVIVVLEREAELTLLRLARPEPVVLRASGRAEPQVRR